MFTCPLWECQPDNSEIWFRLSWNWELNSETPFNSVCVLKICLFLFCAQWVQVCSCNWM